MNTHWEYLSTRVCLPEGALSANRKILQDKPETRLAFGVIQLECVNRRLADEVACVIRAGALCRYGWRAVACTVRCWVPGSWLSAVVLRLSIRMWSWNGLTVGVVLHLRQKHWTVWRWRERGCHAAADADSGCSTAVSNQITCATRDVLMPKVDDEHIEGSVDVVTIDLLSCCGVAHYEADARRWRDGASILSLATSLSCAPLPK